MVSSACPLQSRILWNAAVLTSPLTKIYTVRYTRGMDNREKLLQCALERFADRGYDAVGVQEIVEAAGVTKPTLYHYFGSKLGLLESLLHQRFGGLIEPLAAAADYQHDLPLSLTRVAQVYFNFALREPVFYRLQLGLWFAAPHSEAFEAVMPYNLRQHDRIETMFAAAVQDHGNMRGRQRAYAVTFLGMINTYVGMALNGYARLDDELTHRAVHQFMHGIYS